MQRTSKWPLRMIVNGIFYVLKNGCVWRDVPADLPPWVTRYYYFPKWSTDGTWERGSGCLSSTTRERAKKNAQPTAVILDSQSVKNTATSTARVGDDAGKRIKGRKRFLLVDTLGNLLASCVVAASCHDGTTAAKVWDALALGNGLLDQVQTVFVDGGFGRRFRHHLAQRGIQAQVPPGVLVQKSRFFIPAKRWVVERSIAWASNHRRLAKDYERKTQYANAWLYITTIRRLARLT